MANRQPDIQQRSEGNEGEPDSTSDPASTEVMKKRVIKQPKSRYAAGVSRPTLPEPSGSLFNSAAQPTGTPPASTNGVSLFNTSSPFTTNGSPPATTFLTKPASSLSNVNPTGNLLSDSSFGASPSVTAPKIGLFGSPTTAKSEPPPTEETKKPNPFATLTSPSASLFGPTTASDMSDNQSGPAAKDFNKPKQYTGGLFGSSLTSSPISSNSTNLFGSRNKAISPSTSSSTVLFANANADSTGEKVGPANPPLKPSVTMNSSSAAPQQLGVSYPNLSSISSSKSLFSSVTSPTPNKMSLNIHVPPLPPNLDPSRLEEYEKLYKLRTLNEAFKNILTTADPFGDFREVCNFYNRIAGEILSISPLISKRKEGANESSKQNEGSPKRARIEQGIAESVGAAKLLEGIIDKNTSTPGLAQTEKKADNAEVKTEDERTDKWKTTFAEFKPPSVTPTSKDPAKPIQQPGSTLFTPSTPSASTATPSPSQATNVFSKSQSSAPFDKGRSFFSGSVFGGSAPGVTYGSQPMSNLFAPSGGPVVASATPVSGGLFSNLKPTITKDPEEDEDNSPKKAPSTGPAFFDTLKKEEATKTSPGFFSSQKSDEASAGTVKPGVWTPGTPVVFGGQSTSSNSQPAQPFLFGASPHTSQTSTSGSIKFGANGATVSIDNKGSSFDGVSPNTSAPSTAVGTPGPDSDKESAERGNEPLDDLPKPGEDWSIKGPGEEHEDVVFTARAALFKLVERGFNKIGVGAIRLLKHKDTGKARIILRTEQGRLVLNVSLYKDSRYTVGAQKYTVSIPSFTSKGLVVYMAKLKGSDEAQKLSEALEKEKLN